jgi:hypothetical protein
MKFERIGQGQFQNNLKITYPSISDVVETALSKINLPAGI